MKSSQTNTNFAIYESYTGFLRFLLKIDFGLLIGVVSIVGLLNLDRPDLVAFIDAIKYFIYFVVVLIIIGLALDFILANGTSAKSIKEFKRNVPFLRWSLLIFFVLHAGLIGSMATDLELSLKYFVVKKQRDELKDAYRGSLSRYFDKYHRLPTTFEESTKEFPLYVPGLAEGTAYEYKYHLLDSSNVRIILPGEDNQFNTNDDWSLRLFFTVKYVDQ